MSGPARSRTLYGLNVRGLLGAALERCPGGCVTQDVANELLARYFAEHPEERSRVQREPGEPIRPLVKEENQSAHRLIGELNALERRAARRRQR